MREISTAAELNNLADSDQMTLPLLDRACERLTSSLKNVRPRPQDPDVSLATVDL